MKFVVKNVPPHRGERCGENVICSPTEDKKDKFLETGHINDACEADPCSKSCDSNDCIYQHRIYDAPDTDVLPQYLYMWVDCRADFTKPKKLELKPENSHCGYQAYDYSDIPLMEKAFSKEEGDKLLDAVLTIFCVVEGSIDENSNS